MPLRPWIVEITAGLTITAVVGLGAVAFRYRGQWLGWAATLLLLCAAMGAALFLLIPLPMPGALLVIRWPAFLVGSATGWAVASLLLTSLTRPAPKVGDPGLLWKALTPHDIEFLRRM